VAKPEFDIVVIGGGAGGLVVAAGGAALGAKVALVEKHKMGGDCLNYGCVPSKTLLKSAKVAHLMRTAADYNIPPHAPTPDIAHVMERVAAVIKGIEPNDSPERFRGLGVDVTFGDGKFIAPDCFEVNGRRLQARTFVIATGSRPGIPPIPGLNAVPFLTNETVFDLREQVPSLIVIGSGPIGCEMSQAFARLGTRVTVVDMGASIMPREDGDLSEIVLHQMKKDGVEFNFNASIVKVEGEKHDIRMLIKDKNGAEKSLQATHLLVAAGRRANVEGLGLDAAGIEMKDGKIVSDQTLRTTNPHVFLCGDVAGGLQFTHVAGHHAGVLLRQAIFRMRWAKPSVHVPWCTYTDPELARIGVSESEADRSGVACKVYKFGYEEIDRARAEGETEGFAKVITDPKGRILGAAIVGPHAGEVIHEYVLAVNKGMNLKELSGLIHIYPTFAEINKRVADQRLKEGLTPSSKAWIQRIFGLQGA
jgi:pyruvate/2-oxoglutarate dehydrogenase complex dihydrolipoamide dehydrogenase (E3) component